MFRPTRESTLQNTVLFYQNVCFPAPIFYMQLYFCAIYFCKEHFTTEKVIYYFSKYVHIDKIIYLLLNIAYDSQDVAKTKVVKKLIAFSSNELF